MAQCGTCVSRLYKNVIEEVISGIRESFLDEGIDEQVLADLKQQWEAKLATTKAAEHTEITMQHQASSSSSTTATSSSSAQSTNTQQQNSTSTSAQPMALVPVQITVPSQQAGGVAKTITIHVPSTALSSGIAGTQLQNILSSPAAAQTFSLEASQAAEIIQRQLNAALQQHGVALPPTLLQYNHPTVTQVDGPGDCEHLVLSDSNIQWSVLDLMNEKPNLSSVEATAQGEDVFRISVPTEVLDDILINKLADSQVDGACGLGDSSDEISDDDDDDDEEDEKDDDKKLKDEDDDEEEEEESFNDDPLNSEDDVSDDEGADIFETENVVVCQYDKVTRVRNKWKFHLKDGIMNLRGKDFVFTKATGEGEW